ncbi:type II secretion system protein I/J [Rubinisphaera brasiliensis]|uniref:Type II secretion system protein I/J n=1 Tax=Rubinisphaera brasiliensis (strain ATCC 49424 / DSM 5305 / JCM 21570 / IAM 15109 / NBRC 103401 / IFAM 1448) TaxID=756272 RepID=F0SJH1_RUBBR|nr:type II secretion system protein I/J [Rubinisphaera brasiliensis]ADY60783.1 type II secretion system protein I/J [Rubinisphaera brasiliensis DSM 5305]
MTSCFVSKSRRCLKDCSRHGLTLYEVILSIAILLPALVVLGHSIDTGTRAALQAQRQSEAALLCDTLMAELLAGVRPQEAIGDEPIEWKGPEWSWGLDISPGPHTYLLELRVTVRHRDQLDQIDLEQSLSRYVIDPALETTEVL